MSETTRPKARAFTVDRRDLLKGAGILALMEASKAAAALGTPSPFSPARLGPAANRDLALIELSAREAVAGMKSGSFTAEAYAEALLNQTARCAGLNAFITLEPDSVREAAREADRRRKAGKPLGRLHGLPMPIKDSINTHELPTTIGTNALRDWRPRGDALCVQKLRQAGAIILGKTNMSELSWTFTSDNVPFGQVRNPYDPTRIPGGSSGGTAAAVAGRMAPLGLAEDTKGSIRVPAAICGAYGFRPTTGRYPNQGVAPVTHLFDQVGPVARTVADLAVFDAVMTGDTRPIKGGALKGVRLGIARDYYYSGLDSEVARLTDNALMRLKDAGAVLVDADLPSLAELIAKVTFPIQAHDIGPALTHYLEQSGAKITLSQLLAEATPAVGAVIQQYALPGAPKAIRDDIYADACHKYRPAMRRMFADYFSRHSVAAIVFPTTMAPAPKIGTSESERLDIGGEKILLSTAIGRNITPGSTCGLPGLVLPIGLTNGSQIPVSIEMDGPSGTDREILALGLAVEAVLGHIPPPPVAAA